MGIINKKSFVFLHDNNFYTSILKIKYVRFYREPPSLIQKCNSPPLVYNCGAGPERIRQGGGGGGESKVVVEEVEKGALEWKKR